MLNSPIENHSAPPTRCASKSAHTHAPHDTAHEVDRLYALRSDDAQMVQASLEIIEADAERNLYKLLWRTSRARFFLGQCAADIEHNADAARRQYRAGGRAGLQATRLAPLAVEGWFWVSVNIALLAQLEPKLRALYLIFHARRLLKRAARLDAGYHAAGALRVLARIESKLPFIVGGNGKRARRNFERAISLAPTNTVTRRYFAEMLLDSGENQAARTHLEAIRDAPHDPAWAYESDRDKRYANELLKNLPVT